MRGGQHSDLSCLVDPPGPSYRVEGGGGVCIEFKPWYSREGEQTCDLLCLVVLRSLRKSLDIAAERKRGITNLELFCEELEQAERWIIYSSNLG